MKVCTKCGVEKALSEFRKDSRVKGGRGTICTSCTNAANRAYRKENLSKIRAKEQKYREKSRERISEINRRYKANNKENVLATQKKYRVKNKEKILLDSKKYREENKGKRATYSKRRNSNPTKSDYYLDKLPPSDKAKMKGGFLTVVCKTCKERFAPSVLQIDCRIKSYRGVRAGESNLYCSDDCQNSCPLFRFNPIKQTDPRSKLYVPKTETEEVRSCQTNALKQLQCDEVGYNYCEKCGDIIDVELHHTLLVSEYGKQAINGAGHVLMCYWCHSDLHKNC